VKVQYQLVDIETKKAIPIGDEFAIIDFMKTDFGKGESMTWDEAAILFGDPFAVPPIGVIIGASPSEAAREAIGVKGGDNMTEDFINELLAAAEQDSWCQECGLEHIAPVLAKILQNAGKEVPVWLKGCLR
jgi:hypothetical protein